MRGQKNLYDVLYIAQGYCEAQHECNQYDKKNLLSHLHYVPFLLHTIFSQRHFHLALT